MARVRSPNYPAISLPEAINRAKTIHSAEQHLAAPKTVIAKHLGYGGLNGASIKIISALTKYGLIEEVSDDKVKVSPRAVSILYPSNATEKETALRDAALQPALFAEIFEEWGGERPSDENLRAYLIRRNFASDALDRVIQAYHETMELVARESKPYGPAGRSEEQTSTLMRRQSEASERTLHPMTVAFHGDQLEVSAILGDIESVEQLIAALQATKTLLPKRSFEEKKPVEA